MNTIFAKLLYEMEKKHDTVLVSIISGSGSAPRGAGSQMLVSSRGRLVGSIGGGAVEKRSEELALEALEAGRSFRHDFVLRTGAVEDIGMVCGGDVSVWFQFIAGTDAAWSTLAGELIRRIEARAPGFLLLNETGGPPALAEGCGSIPEGYFALPLPLGDRVVIFGGGHCAQALVPVLKSVGFRVTVMDCRPEYASAEQHPQADVLICGDYLRVEDYITLDENDYAVIMTNGHSHDFEIQAQVLRRPLAYVGVIGSRSKTAAVNARLRAAGIPEDAIATVHTPIGTAIKAVTPAEIAVSIAGELILERAKRREAAGITSHGCPMH